ncbi:MAG TPA: hypothetical protein VJL89_10580 [Thermodesulfovibrionia bacterium]|nr:hypothetical protein [Thermodesulfovibrionia bacterium]
MRQSITQPLSGIKAKSIYFLFITGLLFFLFLFYFESTVVFAEETQEEAIEEADKADEEKESSVVKQVLYYPVNRLLDFADIFRLNVGVGPGIGINIRPTKFAQVGFENYMSARAGLGKNSGFFVKRYGLLYTETELMTMGAGLLYTGGGQRGLTEVGTTFHLLIIGGEAALDLSELADFFLGFTTVDFKQDDWGKEAESD